MHFFDLAKLHKNLTKDLIKIFKKELIKSDFTLGKNVEIFEKNFSEYIGNKFGVALSNGTDAINLALRAIDVKKDDEVLISPHTWISAIFSIQILKAKPVLIDIKDDLNFDEDLIEKKISNKTKAMIITHMHGLPCDMEKILKITKKKKIKIIEDCSQSHGAEFKKVKVGNFSDISTFSFYPSKNLGALGEAGICLTNSNILYQKIKALRNMGKDKSGDYIYVSSNYKVDGLQAAFLNYKLKYLDKWNLKRIKIANEFNKKINNPKIIKPINYNDRKHVYHHYVIRSKNRTRLIRYLKKSKMNYQIHYPNYIQDFKKVMLNKQNTKNTKKIYSQILSIPCNPSLDSTQVNKIIKILNNYK